MVSIQLNGQQREFARAFTVGEILEQLQIPLAAIAVAINSEIVPRSELNKVFIKDGDRLEVVRPVGGG